MATVLIVIAPEQFRDEELHVPQNYLRHQGHTVEVISTRAGEATGMLGAVEAISTTLEDIRPQDIQEYDAVLVAGGMGAIEHLWSNTKLMQLLQSASNHNAIIGGICLSGAVPAQAGLLNGKKATVWETPESLAILKEGGAIYTGEPCTVDGNVVTANGPEAAEAFAKAIAEKLKAKIPA